MARKAEYWTLAEGTENPNDKGAVMRVLFVGNSFIHYNGGAEKVVTRLLEEQLGAKVYTRRYAPGGYTWSQHLTDAKDPSRSLYKLLGNGATKPWDYIIFQEQSQAPALGGKETLLSYQALSGLVELAKMRSAHPVLLMTWGYLEGDKLEHPTIFPDYHAMQERLANGYLSLATRLQQDFNISSLVAPAGLAWQHIHKLLHKQDAAELPAGKKTFFALYAKDGIHPSPFGTYLQACIIADTITGCKASGLTANPLELDGDWLAFLQGVADEVVFQDRGSAYPPFTWGHDSDCLKKLGDMTG
ncbi:g3058 [Coccomyxa elongata]